VAEFPEPTEYFALNVGLRARAHDGFALAVENREGEAWTGRVPVVWVQGGVSWVEILDLSLAPHERREVELRTRWAGTGGPLEARLPVERDPRDLLARSDAQISTWALASNFLPLGRRSLPPVPHVATPAEERRDRVRSALWLAFAVVVGLVAVVLILYATSVL